MPPDALVILDDGDEDLVKDVGPSLAEAVVGLAPAGHEADLASEGDVGGRQADGDDVVLVEHRPLQVQQGHVKTVWLGQHVSGTLVLIRTACVHWVYCTTIIFFVKLHNECHKSTRTVISEFPHKSERVKLCNNTLVTTQLGVTVSLLFAAL